MISSQKIKNLVKKETGERIGKKAIKKLNGILEENARTIIRKAARNANFAGRSTIREDDISET